jgi:hypothetical protein
VHHLKTISGELALTSRLSFLHGAILESFHILINSSSTS